MSAINRWLKAEGAAWELGVTDWSILWQLWSNLGSLYWQYGPLCCLFWSVRDIKLITAGRLWRLNSHHCRQTERTGLTGYCGEEMSDLIINISTSTIIISRIISRHFHDWCYAVQHLSPSLLYFNIKYEISRFHLSDVWLPFLRETYLYLMTWVNVSASISCYLWTAPEEQEDPSPPHWPHWSSRAPDPTTRSQPTLCSKYLDFLLHIETAEKWKVHLIRRQTSWTLSYLSTP